MKKKLCPREFRSLTYADKAMIQYLSHQGQTLEYISEVLDIDMVYWLQNTINIIIMANITQNGLGSIGTYEEAVLWKKT